MPGIGHNKGPTMEPGFAYRKHCWDKARKALIPTLPLNIVKMRVNRARELGLDYKTYASVRASTGRDVIGFLFSSNALRLQRMQIRADVAAKLVRIQKTAKLALIHPPAGADQVLNVNPVLNAAFPAPLFTHTWAEMRDQVKSAIQSQKLPKDGVLVIGDPALERHWADAGQTAGYLSAQRYFGDTA